METYHLETFGSESRVMVLPFSQQIEGEEVIIGRVETGTFLAIPRLAVEVLEGLADGKSIGEVTELYREAHGEVIDLTEFLNILETKGIIERYDGDGQASSGKTRETKKKPATKKYHLGGFPESLAARLASWPAVGVCLLLIAAAALLVIRDHSLFPRREDLFITDHRAIIVSFMILLTYASVMVHEFAHLVAARAIGVNSRIGFGYRLYDFVIETDLTGLWSVPKQKRYFPMMAGCLVDATMSALMIFALLAYKHGMLHFSDVGLRIFKTVLLTNIIRIGWQAAIFVRTDYYYVISNFLNCRNLLGDTEAYVGNLLARVIPRLRQVDQSGIPAAERKVIPYFAVIWAIGRVMAVYWLFIFIVPLWVLYFRELGQNWANYGNDPLDFWGCLAMICIVIGPPILGFVVWVRYLARMFSSSLQRIFQYA